jgi:D-hydroxyproline dehydrogenase subunit beta
MPQLSLPTPAGIPFADRSDRYDVVVVGSGIVGLGVAYDAWWRGLSVAVVDRAAAIGGSSIRNFGHVGVTAQSGDALEYAEEARVRWRRLAGQADFWLSDAGAIVAARAEDELELLREFQAERGTGTVTLLTADKVRECSPVDDVVGGAWLSRDLQVDPRSAAPRIQSWLASVGVHFFWSTAALGVETGVVHTPRGELRGDAIVVAVNFDVDVLYPDLAAVSGLQRCSLEMLAVEADLRVDLSMPLLTGWSMIRYSGFAAGSPAAAVRERLHREHPELAALDVNHMVTQRPNGRILVGDTHTVTDAVSPFQPESAFDRLLEITRELFGVDELRVKERWQGVYAKARDEFLVASPADGVRVASVTTGIGMTTGLGFAASVMEGLLGPVRQGVA